MCKMIYSGKVVDTKGNYLTYERCFEAFKEARVMHEKLVQHHKKIAYFFIDPLMNHFEGGNHFYFRVFGCESISKLNSYKSGASPIQALADAKELLDNGLYDAVFLFGYEPLLTNRKVYGKEAVSEAMNLFEEASIIQCYNEMAHRVREALALSEKDFMELADELYRNYARTYKGLSGHDVSLDRGKPITNHGADLFRLSDCANPNIDFAGGVILAHDDTADLLHIADKDRVEVSGVNYAIVEGAPNKIEIIVGTKETFFPHLEKVVQQVQQEANINVAEEFKDGNLLLEVYTCYPPIPLAFLFATGIVTEVGQLPSLLERHDITITGGMSLARAPWNNPALHGMIEMYQQVKAGPSTYGAVHGNGGIGEIQGIALFAKVT